MPLVASPVREASKSHGLPCLHGRWTPPPSRRLSNQGEELEPLSAAPGVSALVAPLAGLVGNSRVAPLSSAGRKDALPQAAGDSQVEGGRPMQAPAGHPNVSRKTGTVPLPARACVATTKLLRAQRQEAWFLELRAETGRGGAPGEDCTEPVVTLDAVAAAGASKCVVAVPRTKVVGSGNGSEAF